MRCVGPDVLARFLHGQLPAGEVELLQAHLDECVECFKQLALGAAAMSESFGISNRWLSSRLSAMPGLLATPADWSEATALPEETAFGAYVVEGVLGRGGMGVVYRARDTRTGAPVALKTVRTATPAALEALRREILFLAEARHPGLVAILGHEVTQGDPWYAMELLEGETLNDRNRAWWGARLKVVGGSDEKVSTLPDAGAGRLEEVLSLYRRLCEPLDFVHHAGIVHCDLKPANVFLRNGSVPILMDFGLAIQARGAVGRESLSLASRGRGTLPYMCPEVIQGKIPDARADLYALGCMLYESVVGRPPFVAPSRDELVDLHLRAPVVPASARARGVPSALDDLLLGLLVKDPRQRLGEAARVAAVLDALGVPANESQVRARAYLYRPQLVGREAEQQQASELVEQALLGHGSFLMLSGESGIGKTFLVSEVCQRAMLKGMRVVTGGCEVPAAASPAHLHVPRALYPLSNFLNLLRDEYRRAGSNRLERLLGDLRILAAYSPTLAMLPEVLEAGAPAALPDKSARERVLEALRATLSELTRKQPLLIAIDDLQWADELSIAFLESLSPAFLEDVPVLLIGTYRTDESNPTLERLLSRHGIICRSLERLGRPSLSAMVGQMLGKGTPPPSLVDFVDSESEGVPFFVAEYLRSALAERALIVDRGEWTFDRASSSGGGGPILGFPERLKELVRRRMLGLSAPAMRSLEAAAVLGRELEPAVLARVLDCELDEVHEHVVEAMQRGMLERAGDRYRFAHDKFREVAYGSLSPERQLELHEAVACTLERLFAEDSSELERRAGVLARHFERGGKPERALEYFERAGLRALQLSANAEAIGLLRGAVEQDAKLPVAAPALRRAIWERGIAEALAGLGRFADGEQHLRRAASLLGHPIASNNAGAVLQVCRELLRRLVRRVLPASAKPDETRLEAGRVYERVHRSAYFTGKAAHIFVGTLTSLNLWETLQPGPELITAYANTAQLCGVLPAHGWTRSYLERANRALEATPDPAVETLVRLSEGVYFAGVGERAKAASQIERGITIAESIGYHRRHEECLAVRASIDIAAGHWTRAAQWTSPLEASARTRGDTQMLGWGLNQQLECSILQGDYTGVEPLLLKLQGLLPLLNDPDRLWALGLSAYARARQERWVEAEALATRASALLPKVPPVFGYCIGAYDRLTETWLLLLHRQQQQGASAGAQAIRSWRQATRALSRSAKTFPVARPVALLQEGIAHLRGGRQGRAVAAWRRGLDLAAGMQLHHPEARLSQALAKIIDSAADRAEFSRRARAALEAIELPPDADLSATILPSPVRP